MVKGVEINNKIYMIKIKVLVEEVLEDWLDELEFLEFLLKLIQK
jgi:hypothetical protein